MSHQSRLVEVAQEGVCNVSPSPCDIVLAIGVNVVVICHHQVLRVRM